MRRRRRRRIHGLKIKLRDGGEASAARSHVQNIQRKAGASEHTHTCRQRERERESLLLLLRRETMEDRSSCCSSSCRRSPPSGELTPPPLPLLLSAETVEGCRSPPPSSLSLSRNAHFVSAAAANESAGKAACARPLPAHLRAVNHPESTELKVQQQKPAGKQ